METSAFHYELKSEEELRRLRVDVKPTGKDDAKDAKFFTFSCPEDFPNCKFGRFTDIPGKAEIYASHIDWIREVAAFLLPGAFHDIMDSFVQSNEEEASVKQMPARIVRGEE